MSTLTAVTRPTRRDMRRHPWRTLAAFLMIAVPVALITGVLTIEHSHHQQDAMSQQSNLITASGSGHCSQSVDGFSSECSGANPRLVVEQTLAEALPNFQIESSIQSHIHMEAGEAHESLTVLQLSHSPTVTLPGVDEVFLPPSTMRRLGISVGDTVEVKNHGTWTVTGHAAGYQAVVSAPTLIAPATITTADYQDGDEAYVRWFAVGPDALTWADAQKLNQLGFVVESDDLRQNPPPLEEVDEHFRDQVSNHPTDVFSEAVTWVNLFVTVLFLFLFITPVFSVAAGKQAQTYALMRSQGATRGHIRRSVLAYGVLTGLIGATIGALAGVGIGSAYWTLYYPHWPLVHNGLATGVIWLAAVLGAVLAAFIPAVITTKQPLATAIAGGAPDKILRFRPWMLLGVVGVAVGTGFLAIQQFDMISHIASSPTTTSSLVFIIASLAGILGRPLVVAGLAGSAPLLVWLVSRGASSLSTVPRLAMRDVARQSLRSVPTVALILVTSFIAVTAVTWLMASNKRDHILAHATYNPAMVLISADPTVNLPGADYGPAIAVVEQTVGPAKHYPLTRVAGYMLDVLPDSSCHDFERADDNAETARQCYPARYGDSVPAPWFTPLVADENALRTFNFDSPEAEQRARDAIKQPAMLVAKGTAPEGTGTVWLWSDTGAKQEEATEITFLDVLPATSSQALITPTLADELGLHTEPGPMMLEATQPITAAQHSVLDAYSTDNTNTYSISTIATVSFVWELRYLPAVAGVTVMALVLIAITLILVLSTQSTNRHNALLRAIGAQDSIPRRITAAFAAIVALLGTAAGTLTGLIAAWLFGSSSEVDAAGNLLVTGTREFMEVPWSLVGLLVVLTPLLAYVIGLMLHREPGLEVAYRLS